MVIMINKLNIKDITQPFVDNISFIYISNPGCLGLDGTVEFVLSDNKAYSCNVAYKQANDYLDLDLLKDKLSEYNLNLNLGSIINGYESVYLGGCGNFLFMKPKYALNFYRYFYGRDYVYVYQNWYEYAKYALCTKEGTS